MRMYYVDPKEHVAVCILSKMKDIAKLVAKELGLVGVSEKIFFNYRISHGEKTLVL